MIDIENSRELDDKVKGLSHRKMSCSSNSSGGDYEEKINDTPSPQNSIFQSFRNEKSVKIDTDSG